MFLTSTLEPSGSIRRCYARRDVRVAAEGAFFHVAGRDADVAQDLAQGHQVIARFFRGAQVRFADDLHQGNTGAVEIDEADQCSASFVPVDEAPGVFFDVDARDSRLPGLDRRGDEFQRHR